MDDRYGSFDDVLARARTTAERARRQVTPTAHCVGCNADLGVPLGSARVVWAQDGDKPTLDGELSVLTCPTCHTRTVACINPPGSIDPPKPPTGPAWTADVGPNQPQRPPQPELIFDDEEGPP